MPTPERQPLGADRTTPPAQPPAAPTQVEHKDRSGFSFVDPFSWLHDDDPAVLQWQHAEDQFAKDWVRSTPMFRAVHAVLNRTSGPLTPDSRTLPCYVGGRWFGIESARLWTASDIGEPRETIIDLTEALAEADGEHPGGVEVLSFAPSPDGLHVVCGLTKHGDMAGEFRVIDITSSQLLPIAIDTDIPEVPVAWTPDSTAFYRYEPGTLEHQVHITGLVGGWSDRPAFALESDDLPSSVAALALQVSPGGEWMVGTSEPHEHTVRRLFDLRTSTHRRFLPPDFHGECHGVWWSTTEFLAIVTEDSPRGRLCAIPVASCDDRSTWRPVLAESDAVLRTVARVGEHFAVACLVDASMTVLVLDGQGVVVDEIPLDQPGSSPLARHAPVPSDCLVFSHQTFSRSPVTYCYSPATANLRQFEAPTASLAGLSVKYEGTTADDGEHIPFFSVARADSAGTKPGPILIHVYGGFNLPLLPRYLGDLAPFIEAGGTYVQACLRGGGEFGLQWYEAGRGRNQQRTFDDLYSVAEHLIAAGRTTPSQLGLWGRSNGGLVAGVALTQRPELWRVVVPEMPLLDMLEPYGSGGMLDVVRPTFEMDYGNPEDPEWVDTLAAYSPYHNIHDGIPYPAVFQIFGEKDTGCPPFHGRKFTARIRAASSSGAPVLLRVWPDVGHSPSEAGTARMLTSEWLAFAMTELGMNPPPTAGRHPAIAAARSVTTLRAATDRTSRLENGASS